MLTVVFSESTMSKTQVHLWCKRFKESREDVNDDARPGRLRKSTTDENIEALKKMIFDNCRITTTELMLAYRSAHPKDFLRMFWS